MNHYIINHLFSSHIYINCKTFFQVKDVKLVAKSTEKVMSVTISFHNTDAKAILIDSLNFLPSSLQSLVDNLKKKSIVKAIDDDDITDMNASTFQHTTKFFKQKFPELDSSALSLLLQKGVYPYNYITSLEKLSETALPKKDAFFNTLSQEHITDEEYARAQEIWKTFKCKTLGDYHDIYLQSDTCLLADVFENFRSESMKNYGLDPVFFHKFTRFELGSSIVTYETDTGNC